ncbi:MAG: InlB B-repeat-containing protein, partial [Eubacteriales bacterium]|nr:InlB B-repeat-containing protein [Eubacteriales bacterium]
MVDRAVGTYINAPGTYTANGLTIVNTSGTVTLRGNASGVVVTGASGGVRLTLDGARVSGPVEVRPDNVQLTLDEAQVSGDVRVMGQKARVNLNNKAKANDIILESGAHGSSVSFAKGTTAGAVTSDARNTSLSVSGTVDSIGLLAGAASATVEVRSGGKVSSLTCDADKAAIKGSGTLKRATISGDDNKIDTRGTTVRIEKGAANTRVNGVKKNPGTTTSSGSSSSDKDDDDDRSDRYYIEYYVARDGSNDRYDYYTRERVYRGDRPDGVSTPKAPDGYKFDGWYTSRSGSKKFDFSTRIRDDYTLYGRWVKKTTTPVDPDPPKPVTKTFPQPVVLTKSDANKLDSAVWEGNTYKLAFVSG